MGSNPTADSFLLSTIAYLAVEHFAKKALAVKTVWPSGLRRWLKAPFRKGVGSNPTAVTFVRCATAMQ